MPRKINRDHIPTHELGLNDTMGGFMIKRMYGIHDIPDDDTHVRLAHRDDHYMLFLMEQGSCSFMLDFEKVALNGKKLMYILPGQVHHYHSVKAASGWVMGIDTSLIDSESRHIFESALTGSQVCEPANITPFTQLLQLIYDVDQKQPALPGSEKVLRTLLQAFVSMVAGSFNAIAHGNDNKGPRTMDITRRFKQLVSEHYIKIKTPTQYAHMLNISTAYLNEAVKGTTGATVSYWIQQEILLEAKRLLYYTDHDVKQVAYQVGYEDHTYFSRIFKKVVQCTPLEFRNRHRELSNHSV